MAICDADGLEQVANMDTPFEDLWSRRVTSPDDLRELVRQGFGSHPWHLAG